MIKKITAIFLILVVNIFLLTNVVMLHHHHNGIPYFSLFEKAQHDSAENCSKNEVTCQLDQNVDVIYRIEEDCHCFFCCLVHDHDNVLLQAILFYFTSDLTLPDAKQLLRQPPYLISYHSIVATSGRGLRAPPVA
jgi:hypothetical protein